MSTEKLNSSLYNEERVLKQNRFLAILSGRLKEILHSSQTLHTLLQANLAVSQQRRIQQTHLQRVEQQQTRPTPRQTHQPPPANSNIRHFSLWIIIFCSLFILILARFLRVRFLEPL